MSIHQSALQQHTRLLDVYLELVGYVRCKAAFEVGQFLLSVAAEDSVSGLLPLLIHKIKQPALQSTPRRLE